MLSQCSIIAVFVVSRLLPPATRMLLPCSLKSKLAGRGAAFALAALILSSPVWTAQACIAGDVTAQLTRMQDVRLGRV
jgi:hypothetical protein